MIDEHLDQPPPEFQIVDDGIFEWQTPDSAVAEDDGPSPTPNLSEIENLLMADDDGVMPDSDFEKFLAELLFEPPRVDSDDGGGGSTPSYKDSVDAVNPVEVGDEPVSKKQTRQIRNRDAAMRSRERKKSYVKDLEMKSRYYEGECRRLGYLLQCSFAENHALRLCLQARGGALGASMTEQESAVLLLESLLLGSLLWFMGIMCQLNLPLVLWLTVVLLPRENVEQKDLRSVVPKSRGSNISMYFMLPSLAESRRCRPSRAKMKMDYLVLYSF